MHHIQVLTSDFGGGGGLAVVTLVQPLGGFEFGGGGEGAEGPVVREPREDEGGATYPS